MPKTPLWSQSAFVVLSCREILFIPTLNIQAKVMRKKMSLIMFL